MIYNGRTGYINGSLNQVPPYLLAMTKGPIKGRNWNFAATNPSFSVTVIGTGAVKLQGTNDVAIRSDTGGELNPIEMDLLPTEGASWADLATVSAGTTTGSITVEYQFLRLIVSTQGTGTVLQAWVRWS